HYDKQYTKYTTDIEDLSFKLKSAYINEGVPPHLAGKYTTKTTTKAISSNTTSEKMKLVCAAANFNRTRNNACNIQNKSNRGHFYGEIGTSLRGRGDYRNWASNGHSTSNERQPTRNYRGNYRGRNRHAWVRNFNGNQNQGNDEAPQDTHLDPNDLIGEPTYLMKRNKINPEQIVCWKEASQIRGTTNDAIKSVATTNTYLRLRDVTLPHKFHIVADDFPIPTDGILDAEEVAVNVVAMAVENPSISSRQIEVKSGISRRRALSVLKKHKFRPFKIWKQQQLQPTDPERRLEFCNWYLQEIQQDPLFFRNIIWTDESYISSAGIFNRNNEHWWSDDNPHRTVDVQNQGRFGFSVWCALFGNRILAYEIYEENLTSQRLFCFHLE
ncbi:hypothetical protein NQ317_018107, partial [Molorchus minor]